MSLTKADLGCFFTPLNFRPYFFMILSLTLENYSNPIPPFQHQQQLFLVSHRRDYSTEVWLRRRGWGRRGRGGGRRRRRRWRSGQKREKGKEEVNFAADFNLSLLQFILAFLIKTISSQQEDLVIRIRIRLFAYNFFLKCQFFVKMCLFICEFSICGTK